MRQLTIRCITVLLLGVGLAACNPDSQGPTTWIDRPLDGSHVELVITIQAQSIDIDGVSLSVPVASPTATITIQAHSSDADGVSRLEFSVSGTLLGTIPVDGSRFAGATVGWAPTVPGTYVVMARAVDTQGNYGPPATSRITVGEALATPTPVVAISPTPLPVVRTITPTPVVTITPTPASGQPPPVCPGPPVIAFFTANPTTITYGQTITFSWGAITNADDAVIDAIGHIALNGGSWPLNPPPVNELYPTTTTTFTLTAVGCGGTTTKQVTVVVNPAQPPPPPPPVCPGPPVIVSFTANPSTIIAGQFSTLSWGAVSNATSAVIDQGIGGVGTPGSTTVSPATTTTYTLIASGCGGTVRRPVTIVVNPAPPPPPPPPPPLLTVVIDTTPPSISGIAANPTTVVKQGPGCPSSSRTTTIRATVTDPGGIARVVARVSGVGEFEMSPAGGGVYQATLGPFSAVGTLSIFVQARDNAGNTATSAPLTVYVVPCIE